MTKPKVLRQVSEDATLPHNIEAEQSLLASMILNKKALLEIRATITPEDFYRPAHQVIFEGIDALLQDNSPVNLVSLRHKLRQQKTLEEAGGVDYLVNVAESVPSTQDARAYIEIVRDLAIRRKVAIAANILRNAAYDDLDQMRDAYRDLGLVLQPAMGLSRTLEEVDISKPQRTIPTPFANVNQLGHPGGWPRGDFSIMTAPTGVGKTILLTQCVVGANSDPFDENPRIVFATFEMSESQIKRRILTQLTGVHRAYNLEQQTAFDEAEKQFKNWDVTIYDPTNSADLNSTDVENLHHWLLAEHARRPVDMVLVDYVQLLTSSRARQLRLRRQEELAVISRTLRQTARVTDSAVVAGAQLTQQSEARGPKRWVTRESQDIEHISAMHLRLERDLSSDEGKVVIAKARHQTSGVDFVVNFDRSHLKYLEDEPR